MTDCKLITGDDCIAGFDCVDVVIKNCEISSACSAFRFGGNNILIDNCNIYGPCIYQFRGSFSPEEKAKSLDKSQVARNNMLCFFTYFVTDDLHQQKQPGNIFIKNCKVIGADKFLHINLSGNETWQRGNPPTDITFENITAENIKAGLYGYGNSIVNYQLNLKNITYSIAASHEEEPLFKVAHFGEINIKDMKIDNFNGDTLIKSWAGTGKVRTDNLICNYNNLVCETDKEFICRPI